MGQAQFLGQQIQRRDGAVQVSGCRVQMAGGALKRVHVALAGDEQAFGYGVPAGLAQQRGAQVLQAGAGAG